MSPRSPLRLLLPLLLNTLLLATSVGRSVCAQEEARPLELGVAVERDISGGEGHDYRCALQAGQFLHLQWGHQKVGLVLAIFAPDGGPALEVNHEVRTQGLTDVGVVADVAGVYRINIRYPSRSAPADRYRLTAVEVRVATEQDRKRFSAEVASAEAEALGLQNTAKSRRDAIARYEEAVPLWHDAGDPAAEASTLISIGRIHENLAQYQKALDSFNHALAIARASGYRQGEVDALGNMAMVYHELGDTQKAIDLNRQTLSLAHDIGDRTNEASVLGNMALIYENDLHDGMSSLEYYKQALQIFQEVGDRRREAVTLNNIGSSYKRGKDYGAALDYYGRSLALRRETKDTQGEAASLNNIGAVYQLLGEYQKALDYLSQSYAIIHVVGYRRGEALTLFSMAQSLESLGRPLEAVGRMEEGLKIIESMRSDLVGEEDRATFFASSESFYKFYVNLLMKLQQQDPSGGYSAAALQSNERAHARVLLDQLNEARVNLRQDVDPALLGQERQVQQQINNTTLARRAIEKAPHTPEQLAASQKEIDTLLARYQELEAQIRASSPRYAALTRPQLLGVKEIQRQVLDPDTVLLEYMLGNGRSYLWLVSSHSADSFILPPRAQIEKAAQRYYDLLTARGQRVKFETPEEKSARVAQADAELQQVAVELGRVLLAPVAQQLGNKRLLVVGDGLLHLVPFAALPDPTNPTRPLVVGHEIVNVPSASALAELRRVQQGRKMASKAIAVLADPVFEQEDERVRALAATGGPRASPGPGNVKAQPDSADELTRSAKETGVSGRDGIPRLPFTRQEANAIAALVPRQEREEALDFDASRTTATSAGLGQYRYIHFATHGLLNNDHPELSGVVLSLIDRQGRVQDGFLRASEIFHLKLPAELVVLSGCRTGLGKQTKGEGMVGLTQGFMYAGAARVMVSLWDVNDLATAVLMERFYKSMLGKEHLSPAGALRAAQVSVWQDRRWQSPYYWSGFVLQGEPR
jgi:CHAT domain-containing protein/Tfp pilus assembly protein PilF